MIEPQGCVKVDIATHNFVKQSWMRSIIWLCLRKDFCTDDSEVRCDWNNGNDIKVSITFPQGRYGKQYLRKVACKLKEFLLEFNFAKKVQIYGDLI